MNRENIIVLPNPKLRQISERVGYIDDSVKKLVQDMVSATVDWEDSRKDEIGVALAAVQIGDLRRVAVVRRNFEDKSDKEFEVFINPEIVKRTGKIIKEPEGCLSVANVYGVVPRYETIKVKALDLNGKPVRLTLSGFLARVFQHEIDHMLGKLYVDRVEDDEFYHLKEGGQFQPLTPDEIKQHRLLWHS